MSRRLTWVLLLAALAQPAPAQVSFSQSAVDRLELVVRGESLAAAVSEVERQMGVTIQLTGDADFPVNLNLVASSRDEVIEILAREAGFLALGSKPRYQLYALDLGAQGAARGLLPAVAGTRTTTYRLEKLDPATAAPLLEARAIPGLTVQQYAPLTALILKGPVQSLLDAVSFLDRVDASSRLVFIEFLVVQFLYDDAFNWGYSLVDGTRRQLSDVDFAPGSGQLSFTYNFVDVLDPRFLLNLVALVDDGDARVVSNPHLAVLDRQTGEISLTETIYVPVSDTDANDFGNVLTFEEVNAAVALKVKPTVKGPNEIDLEIQDGTQIQAFTAVQGDSIATTTHAISTTVRVGNNQTLILGGLIDRQSTREKGGVPGLRKLPLLGPLFRNRSRQVQIAETVIYITPRLEVPSVPGLSESLNARSQEIEDRLEERHEEKLPAYEQQMQDPAAKKKQGRRSRGEP